MCDILKTEFGETITNPGIKVLDPFTGTGTFIVRLLDKLKDLGISQEELKEKYEKDIWCNEIMLLAYYIALVNIEDTYGKLSGEYRPFNHAVLTDTFQMAEKRMSKFYRTALFEEQEFSEANNKAKEEDETDIRIIIGNPPYSAKQKNAANNNANLSYSSLDKRIQDTYSTGLQITNKAALHDSYVRAFRWASDRVGDTGIIAFVTNGTFIDNISFRKFRKTLSKEFSKVYVLNLKGNFRKFDKKEGENIFGNSCGTTVCITFLVKNHNKLTESDVHYFEIGDGLNRTSKLEELKNKQTYLNFVFTEIKADSNGDWLNKVNPKFSSFYSIGSKKSLDPSIFGCFYSRGITSGKDGWVYSLDRNMLIKTMDEYVNAFNSFVDYLLKNNEFNSLKNSDDKKKFAMNCFSNSQFASIKITEEQALMAARGEKIKKENTRILVSMFRPFVKKYCYYNKALIQRTYRMDNLFPSDKDNIVITTTGLGGSKNLSCLVSNKIVDLNLQASGAQCYPLYWYDNSSNNYSLFGIEKDDYSIQDNVVNKFINIYNQSDIDKEMIFYYIYAVLHSERYLKSYSNNLAKESPRIPFLNHFNKYYEIGKKLAKLHLNYEKQPPYKGVHIKIKKQDYTVNKIKFLSKDRMDAILFNNSIEISNIPLKVYNYKVNGKSPIEWVLDQYQYTVDKDSGIISDPNKYDEEKGGKYILDLILSLLTVSLETIKLIESLPPYEEI